MASWERVNALLASQRVREAAATLPHPEGFVNRKSGEPLSLLDWTDWMKEHGGERAWNLVIYKLEQL